MGKQKPLSVVKFADAPEKPGRPFPTLAFLAAFGIFAALFLASWFLLLKPMAVSQGEERIDVFLLGGTPLFENSTATAKAYSSCGTFGLFLDDSQIAEGEVRAEATIRPSRGAHVLSAKNSRCAYALNFMVLEKQCEGNEKKPCTMGSCEGVKICFNGIFSECTLPKKICVPGERMGCSLDGCKFGYQTCNGCGSGFGPCLPAGGTESSITCIPAANTT